MKPSPVTTALVTGATGMIGHHLVERLLREGLTVRALVRPTSRVEMLRGKPVEIITGDSADDRAIARAVHGVSYVFHAAGYLRTGSAFSAADNYTSYEL